MGSLSGGWVDGGWLGLGVLTPGSLVERLCANAWKSWRFGR
jgi:hypothetical protein